MRRQLRAPRKRRLLVRPSLQHLRVTLYHAVAAVRGGVLWLTCSSTPQAQRFGVWAIVLGAVCAPQRRHQRLSAALLAVLQNLLRVSGRALVWHQCTPVLPNARALGLIARGFTFFLRQSVARTRCARHACCSQRAASCCAFTSRSAGPNAAAPAVAESPLEGSRSRFMASVTANCKSYTVSAWKVFQPATDAQRHCSNLVSWATLFVTGLSGAGRLNRILPVIFSVAVAQCSFEDGRICIVSAIAPPL